MITDNRLSDFEKRRRLVQGIFARAACGRARASSSEVHCQALQPRRQPRLLPFQPSPPPGLQRKLTQARSWSLSRSLRGPSQQPSQQQVAVQPAARFFMITADS